MLVATPSNRFPDDTCPRRACQPRLARAATERGAYAKRLAEVTSSASSKPLFPAGEKVKIVIGMSSLATNTKKRLFLAAKLIILAAVAVGIWFTVTKALADVERQKFSLTQIDVRWVIVAGLTYLAGMIPCWLFWHQTLYALGQRPTLWETFRAYYISHLGKYVPGKATVVIIRTSWVRSERTDTTLAAISIFIETLTFMAVAAFTAGVILLIWYPSNIWLLITAVGLMIGSGAPTNPAVLRIMLRLLRVTRFNPDLERALDGLNYRLMISGWLAIFAGWLVLGFSLWACLAALPGVRPTFEQLPLIVACLSLSSVAGFVSMIPGGLVVREFVTIEILRYALHFSDFAAVVSSVVLRLACLLSEAAIMVILYIVSILRHEKRNAE